MHSRGWGAKYGLGEGVAFFVLSTHPKDPIAQLADVYMGCGSTGVEAEVVPAGSYQRECGEYGTAQAYGLVYAFDHLLGSGGVRVIRASEGDTVTDIAVRGV